MIIDTAIFDFTGQKNLGRAYNESMALVPDDSHVCLRDGDTCWLTPDYGTHLAEYIRLHPNDVLTCWTNRINERAEQQYKGTTEIWNDGLYGGEGGLESISVRDCEVISNHLNIAHGLKESLYSVTPLQGFVSGFCLVVPKKIWLQHKFTEVQKYEDRGPTNMLGVDNDWTNRIRAAGIQVLRMDGIYLFHIYRMLQGDHDKTHLL